MKFKIFFIIPIVILFNCANAFAQDTVTVFANNKKVISFISDNNTTDKIVQLKKLSAKKTKQLSLQVQGVHTTQSAYRKSLEITDSDGNQSSTLELEPGSYSKYNIIGIAKKYNLFNGAAIKLFLLLNPANKRMMFPSKRIFLATLTDK